MALTINSYYYAHTNTPNGPQWDGKEEPRLLSKTVSTEKPIESIPFEYAWMDVLNSIRIYIDHVGAHDIDDSMIMTSNTESSAEFILKLSDTKRMVLNLHDLLHPIESISWRKKTDKFVVTLKKVEGKMWHSLKKSS